MADLFTAGEPASLGASAPVPSHTPLNPGDRVISVHARRTGEVVKVYGDGWASVRWDDERMPPWLLQLDLGEGK